MMEIYIEGQKLDVSKGEASLLTFAIDDIKDFSSRNTTFSKTIVLPGTANNNRLFGSIFDVKIQNPYNSEQDNVGTNFNASVGASCLIFQDRLQVFKGTLRMLEVVIDNNQIEYEVSVFGELGGLVAALGNLRLEDLDFSDYDHIWNVANITGTWDNINGSGYYYPLIDYGGVSTDKVDYDIRALRPAFFVREYIDKIFDGAGYVWSSDLFNTSRFKSLIVPNNQKSLQTLQTRFLEGIDVSTQTVIQNGVDDENVITQALRNLNEFTYSGGVYTYTGVDTRTFLLSTFINGNYYSTIESIQLGIKKNGTQVYTYTPFLSPTFGTTDTNFAVTFQDVYVTLATNDTIELFAKVGNNVGSYRVRTTFVSLYADLSAASYTDANPGDTLVVNDTLPKNISQVDFLRSIVKLFNLYVYEDRLYPKKLLIAPYVDYFDLNPSGVVDWTYKVDRSKAIRLKPMSELNSRFYHFKFKQDNDYYNELYRKTYNENYGDNIYDSGYEFANEKTDIDLIFAASVLVGYSGVDKVVPALYKKNNANEEAFPMNIRIMQAKKVTGVASWDILDGVSTLASGLTTYGYGGHYDDPDAPANDIQWGVPKELYFSLAAGAINVHQFNVYWSPYMAEITDKDSKLMSCYVKLNNADIFNLDFSKLIFIDGSYWRMNKIEDWNATEPDVCKAEFLKVINTLY